MDSKLIYSHTSSGIDNIRTLDREVTSHGFQVPVGFTWGSTPKPVRFVMPKWGEESIAFMLHDYLYSVHAPANVTRKEADLFLYNDLRQLGVGRVRAWFVYKTARAFGGMYFRTGDVRIKMDDLETAFLWAHLGSP
jgi:hypothetical protein